MSSRLKAMVTAALAAVLATAALAIAQEGTGGSTEEIDPERGGAYGACVSEASETGAADPAAECADLRPGPPADRGKGDGSDSANGDGNGNGNDRERNGRFAEECADVPKEDGSFGKCVSDNASAFGKCVSAAAQEGTVNPAAACADLHPGAGAPGGPPQGTPNGPPAGAPGGPPQGTPNGPPSGTPNGPPSGIPSGPPSGTPSGPPSGTPGGPPAG